MNEGLYFCKLHGKRYCEDHLCEHLAAQYEDDTLKRRPTVLEAASVDSTLFGMEDDETEKGFSAYSEEQLRTIPEMRLVMRKSRLFAELKRISRELERRMVYSAEMQGIHRRSPVMPGSPHTIPFGQSAFIKDVKKEARKDAADAKRQAKIQQAITLLSDMVAKGQVTKQQLTQQVRKVK
ncbi:MAG TPA: hypothetical protein VGF75_00390 [Candidatus Saccharimonadales bacterium]|jgi:hypothetical protein